MHFVSLVFVTDEFLFIYKGMLQAAVMCSGDIPLVADHLPQSLTDTHEITGSLKPNTIPFFLID